MVGTLPPPPKTEIVIMATFSKIDLDELSRHEGGFVNHPNDPGKETNRGVTIKTWNAVAAQKGWTVGVEGLKKMTQDQWVTVAREAFWNGMKLDSVDNQAIADAIFHITWGSGPANSALIVQKALNDIGVTVAIDGLWGPETRGGIARANPAKLLPAIVKRHYAFLDALTQPGTQWNVFREGLLSRAKQWYASWTNLLGEAGQAIADSGASGGTIVAVGVMFIIGWIILKK
jgi:type VI secretion system secreted protein VgrG